MEGSDYHKLCQYWREQVSRYQIWTTGTKYRGIMILILNKPDGDSEHALFGRLHLVRSSSFLGEVVFILGRSSLFLG